MFFSNGLWVDWWLLLPCRQIPSQSSNKDTKTKYEVCSKLPEYMTSDVCHVNFESISQLVHFKAVLYYYDPCLRQKTCFRMFSRDIGMEQIAHEFELVFSQRQIQQNGLEIIFWMINYTNTTLITTCEESFS